MPRFVLLYHACPPSFPRHSHWDLMLEEGESLRTWALQELPNAWHAARATTATTHPDCAAIATTNMVAAEQLANHRQAYLESAGPLSGNRGDVTRIDSGTYHTEHQSPQSWRVELIGDQLHGVIELQQLKTALPNWSLTANSSA